MNGVVKFSRDGIPHDDGLLDHDHYDDPVLGGHNYGSNRHMQHKLLQLIQLIPII